MAMLDVDALELLRLRWRRICNAFVGIAHLHGLDVSDILVTGTPIRLDIETWCSVSLIEGPGDPVALIRSLPPSGGVLSAALAADDVAVAGDIADAIDALRHRRARVCDQDRLIVEQELAEMAASMGWHCDGVGGRKPLTAAFRDHLDSVRGRLMRTDRADGDPAAARFGILVEVGSLTYAQALGVLTNGIHFRSRCKIILDNALEVGGRTSCAPLCMSSSASPKRCSPPCRHASNANVFGDRGRSSSPSCC